MDLIAWFPGRTMLTADAAGIFRQDNHGWLFRWKSGSVFQAGPSKSMNRYGTTGTGSQTSAGLRASDTDSMNGNAIMYDAVSGKILTVGRSPSYQDSNTTSNAHLITISTLGSTPTVTTLTSMKYKRAFAFGVVLPNGKVMITGGQSYAVPFTGTDAVLTPELWDPSTQAFTILAPHTVPRTYHSVAILMLDGRVFTGGGGLCGGCETNHEDAQIYSPSYLFNTDDSLATRPTITSVTPSSKSWDEYRRRLWYPHLYLLVDSIFTMDTDQRRIALTPVTTSGITYTLAIPSDPGIAIPGYWMLFVLNSAGVPSMAATIQITL